MSLYAGLAWEIRPDNIRRILFCGCARANQAILNSFTMICQAKETVRNFHAKRSVKGVTAKRFVLEIGPYPPYHGQTHYCLAI